MHPVPQFVDGLDCVIQLLVIFAHDILGTNERLVEGFNDGNTEGLDDILGILVEGVTEGSDDVLGVTT